MIIFDLKFTDGKACRYLCPDPEANEQTERAALEAIFCGRLASMTRIIAPPPEKLPWKRDSFGWSIGNFKLIPYKDGDKKGFTLTWPGGEVTGDKDDISSAVRKNWHLGV